MKLIHSIVAFLVLAFASAVVNAGQIHMHGNACSAAPGSTGSNLSYSGYGWTNLGSSTGHAICGVSLPSAFGAVTSAQVIVYDRAGNGSFAFSCALNALDSNGNLVFGGSYAVPPSNYSQSSQAIDLLGGAQVPSSAVFLSVDCFVPPPSTGPGPTMSHLAGITIGTQF